MTTAHLIHGYLCAGKTTVAKGLENELGAVRFSVDEWMIKLFGTNPPEAAWSRPQFDDYFRRVRTVMDDVWPSVLRVGGDVILDFGFWSRADRDEARRHAGEAGAEARLYLVRCAEGTARARCRRRNPELQTSFFIDDEAFDVLRSRFEPLEPGEQHEVIVTD